MISHLAGSHCVCCFLEREWRSVVNLKCLGLGRTLYVFKFKFKVKIQLIERRLCSC
jgi:hypothetical protein